MYTVICNYYGTESTEQFKTRKQAWSNYAGMYQHFLDTGNAEIKMLAPDGGVLYWDTFC